MYKVSENKIESRLHSDRLIGIIWGDKPMNNMRKRNGLPLKRKQFYRKLEQLHKQSEIRSILMKIVNKLNQDNI